MASLGRNEMAEHFDVIIVGARCAGSPLATLLARAGMRVCVVDRAGFPSDTPSTHTVQPSGVKVLQELGVAERLVRVAPPIEHGRFQVDDIRIEIDGLTDRFGAPMLNLRRVTLDAILLDVAAEAGAEVRTQTAVTGLVEEDGRVVGVTTAGGELRAPLVVGADGARSTVARMVGAAEYHRTPPGGVFLWAYLEGVPDENDGVWLGKLGENGFLASQTDSGLFMAAVVLSIHRREELRGDREGAYVTGLTHWPELQASLGEGRRVGPVHMMSRWHGFFRESAGPGWVLVGDAGHFKDPTPGQGISDALRQAVELAAAIEKGLGGEAPADQVLADWWAWRDADAWEMYWFAHDMGAPGAPPLVLKEIQRRIAADPELTEAFMGVFNHDVPPSEAFSPMLAVAAAFRTVLANPGQRRAVLSEIRTIFANQMRRRARAPRRRRRRDSSRPGHALTGARRLRPRLLLDQRAR
jgi:2-polyprenyl-6-methoxyphenol hydroxylase-like FAD-dependent oxidoreductase